ncbi:MAG: DUF2520 domain-containing protein [Elusimicrobiota bacterium]
MSEILIIGNSKASKNFSAYLNFIGLSHTILPLRKTIQYKSKIKEAKIIFILTKDDEILKFYSKNKKILSGKKLFHFSGTVYDKNILSLHPIISFPKNPITGKEFEKIIFTSENPVKAKKELRWFKNKIININPENKSEYHMLLTILLNFPLILIENSYQVLVKKYHIPEKYLSNLILKTIQNYIENNNQLTGPLIRKDFKTIKLHLKHLTRNPLRHIYYGFIKYCKEVYDNK